MKTMDHFFIEAGTNHFGKVSEANKILNFFLNSNFKNLTFMIQSKSFYEKHKKKGIDFTLKKNFYIDALKKCHEKKKYFGLAVCSEETFQDFYDLKFDFYKLLSLAINNKKLIKMLKKKNKPIFVSTGFNSNEKKIKKCLSFFNIKSKITLLHSPMTYSSDELNLKRVEEIKKKYSLKTGYSNHYNNINVLYQLSAYNPDAIFLYCKQKKKRGRIYPDDEHAFYFKELNKIIGEYKNYVSMHKKLKKIKQIKIFADEFKI